MWSKEAYLSWTAGIVDGEGCIRLKQIVDKIRGASFILQIVVVNTDIKILKKLQFYWGGCIRKRKMYSPKHKQSYDWEITSSKGKAFLIEILPYIVSKRDQAKLGISFQARIDKSKSGGFTAFIKYRPTISEKVIRAEMYNEMRVLNKHG
jgi:hypothetical protein